MIGVSLKTGQHPIAEEFFELFKTPWEVYDPSRRYDVVLTTRSDLEIPDANLVIVFGSTGSHIDQKLGLVEAARHRAGAVIHEGSAVPIYGEMLTFARAGAADAWVAATDGIAGLCVRRERATVLRVGYDLFEEIRFLISTGQPAEYAETPTLDLHIAMLRTWIRDGGISFVEIPPTPAGYPFAVCLTHDIDFVGIRDHKFDHSMFGFLYRATLGSIRSVLRGRLPIARLLQAWRAAAALPFVYFGWVNDFWEPFQWYLTVERGLGATYFLIPFKGLPGERHTGAGASRRATAYDVTTIPDAVKTLVDRGCEVGVHGIDAWHSAERGRAERVRVAEVSGSNQLGIRMHWLLHDSQTPKALDEAGYLYDSTGGYNEAIGYRHGTGQVFRPIGSRTLLELPMHIQDGALFFPERLDLPESTAWLRCGALITRAKALGGVLTLLWHDRSHGPERFWGDFYVRLVQELRSCGAWFGTGAQVTRWFATRRAVRFDRAGTAGDVQIRALSGGRSTQPPLIVRVHHAAGTTPAFVDTPWTGASPLVVAPRQDGALAASAADSLPRVAGGC